MSELRHDPLKDNWVLLAPRRRERPIKLQISRKKEGEDCPFCEGREHLTPKEIWAIREEGEPDGPGWKVRVVPNKYPALSPNVKPVSLSYNDLFLKKGGYGFHEVILETPRHDQDLADLDHDHLFLVLYTYRERMRSLYEAEGISYVQIFRNWGPLAGASLPHPHTQVLALAQIPDVPEKELKNMGEKRVLCKMIERELKERERVLLETGNYLAFVPFAARFAFEVMILPKVHLPDFRDTGDLELKELSSLLKRVLGATKNVLGDISYNLILHSLPDHDFHWHIEITPRIAGWAGFELGTGYFINTVSPEEAAEKLRASMQETFLSDRD